MKTTEQKLSYTEVAKLTGIPVNQISRYLRALVRPSPLRAQILQTFTGIPASVFLMGSEKEMLEYAAQKTYSLKGRPSGPSKKASAREKGTVKRTPDR